MISGSGTSTRKDEILAALNAPQRSAVERTEGPVLILAGAGSGKTRVLTHRMAYLIQVLDVPPANILAFTFTNKAAGEMKERIEKLLGRPSPSLWVGTFHSTCVRILRAHGQRSGIERGFTIYDTDDQEAVLRKVLRDLNLGQKEMRPALLRSKISSLKNRMILPQDYESGPKTHFEELVAKTYLAYQAELERAQALDFDDLILETVFLLGEHEEIREKYANRFRYVHVDEYQDTNLPQFELIRLLSSVHRNLCVVGDDDQSIYRWRGADAGNILSFETHLPEAFVVRLEQNYRSTGTILAGANAVVKNNSKRKDKTLWTEKPKGEPIRLVLVQDEEDEGRFVVERMTRAVQKEGRSLRHLAVLYRTNAQSRAIENALRRAAIPYELVGGIPFYQRREVKDLLAYLRLAVNEADDLAFRRVFNVPRRGLGKTTLDRLAAMAFLKGVSLMVAARTIRQEPELTSSAREKISAFLEVVEGVKSRMNEPVGEVLLSLVQTLDYGTYLTENEPDTAAERRENVEELIVGARQFSERVEEPTVEAFLNEVSLLTDADRVDESAEKVRLMTAHNAKGLEFDTVFLTGLEEGLFPHASSAEDREELEEERRLFYVGMTRAREQVFLTAAAARRRFWASGSSQLSRFVREIPSEFIEADVRVSDLAPFASGARPARPAGQTSRLKRSRTEGEEIQLGPRHVVGRIIHPTFGAGDVVAQEGTGPEARLTVLFGGGVMKKIVARYAQWEESDVDF